MCVCCRGRTDVVRLTVWLPGSCLQEIIKRLLSFLQNTEETFLASYPFSGMILFQLAQWFLLLVMWFSKFLSALLFGFQNYSKLFKPHQKGTWVNGSDKDFFLNAVGLNHQALSLFLVCHSLIHAVTSSFITKRLWVKNADSKNAHEDQDAAD